MHYRNGRPAKNGDEIVSLESGSGKINGVGVLIRAVPGNEFTCQYCGRIAPDVVLNVDHIQPVSNGGNNDLSNLITSCFDCNSGKSDRKLSDDTIVKLQHAEVSIIDERRIQLKMMKEWRDECLQVIDQECDLIEEVFASVFHGGLTDVGRNRTKVLIKKYGFEEVFHCTEIACDAYSDSNTAFEKLSGILCNRERGRRDPVAAKTAHVIAILRKRGLYCSPPMVRELVKSFISSGCNLEELLQLAKTSKTWTFFCDDATFLLDDFCESGLSEDLDALPDPEHKVW